MWTYSIIIIAYNPFFMFSIPCLRITDFYYFESMFCPFVDRAFGRNVVVVDRPSDLALLSMEILGSKSAYKKGKRDLMNGML